MMKTKTHKANRKAERQGKKAARKPGLAARTGATAAAATPAPRPHAPPDIIFRDAMAADIPAIVKLLANDPLGKKREKPTHPLPQSYWDAFGAIIADPRSRLIVVERDRQVVATMQLTFIPALTHQGAERLLVEAVNVAADARGRGIGTAMMGHAIDAAKARGCRFVSLTSHKSRKDAHEFYKKRGFARSHHGFRYEIRD